MKHTIEKVMQIVSFISSLCFERKKIDYIVRNTQVCHTKKTDREKKIICDFTNCNETFISKNCWVAFPYIVQKSKVKKDF